jgi:hypothetical protein
MLDSPRGDPAKGRGGSGTGGGKGPGSGVGEGTGTETGTQGGPGSIRQRRQNRWKMMFNTFNGEDYLKQLRGLGAILAIPHLKPGGGNQIDYLVIRDIKKNAVAVKEDVTKFNRLFWMDNQRNSVLSVAQALGLRVPPPFFVAFFPKELEDHLRRLEEQAYSGDEDRIIETRFRVVNRGGVFTAELDGNNPIVLKR